MRWIRFGPVECLQWKDNKVGLVSMIATKHKNISQRNFCNRRAKVNVNFRKLDVRQPEVVRDYNKYMGGVHRSDQMIGKYKVLRRSSKFWKTIFLSHDRHNQGQLIHYVSGFPDPSTKCKC